MRSDGNAADVRPQDVEPDGDTSKQQSACVVCDGGGCEFCPAAVEDERP